MTDIILIPQKSLKRNPNLPILAAAGASTRLEICSPKASKACRQGKHFSNNPQPQRTSKPNQAKTWIVLDPHSRLATYGLKSQVHAQNFKRKAIKPATPIAQIRPLTPLPGLAKGRRPPLSARLLAAGPRRAVAFANPSPDPSYSNPHPLWFRVWVLPAGNQLVLMWPLSQASKRDTCERDDFQGFKKPHA